MNKSTDAGSGLLERWELQAALVETLHDTQHHRHLAPRVARCHHSFRHWRCENEHDWAEAELSCSVRVCPHDSRRRALVLGGRIQRAVEGMAGLRYVVLAERNSECLLEGMASLWGAWTRLRRSVRWRNKVKGCIVALEVTYNREEGTWHPHLNVLMEGEYFPFAELNRAWCEATRGRGYTSFIAAANAGTVSELIKYACKLAELVGNAPALDEFLTGVAGRRLVRTYGTFYGLRVEDEASPGVECPDCGSCQTVKLGWVAAEFVSMDAKGVLRGKRSAAVTASELREAVQFPPPVPPAPLFPGALGAAVYVEGWNQDVVARRWWRSEDDRPRI